MRTDISFLDMECTNNTTWVHSFSKRIVRGSPYVCFQPVNHPIYLLCAWNLGIVTVNTERSVVRAGMAWDCFCRRDGVARETDWTIISFSPFDNGSDEAKTKISACTPGTFEAPRPSPATILRAHAMQKRGIMSGLATQGSVQPLQGGKHQQATFCPSCAD